MRAGQTKRRPDTGDALFAAFLLAYAAISAAALPYDFRDLCYLFSLEQGRWVMQEWVHPIYVPTLDLLRHALAIFGHSGPMVIPVEALSIAAALLSYVLLYRLARRFPAHGVAAVVAIAITALSPGFWAATVRPTPYSLTLLFQVLALSLLITDRPPAPRRYALAGVCAGIATGYHASAMALGVVGIASALGEDDQSPGRRATRQRIVAFAASMSASAAACWTIFVLYRDIGAAFFAQRDFWSTFTAIEQVPGTSIYTSGSVAKQISEFTHTIGWQTGRLPALALLFAAIIAARRWRSGTALAPRTRRLLLVATANFAAIAAFFLINNTHNGLIFASLTLAPVVLAVAVGDSWLLFALLCVLAAPRALDNTSAFFAAQADRDPLLAEVHFLDRQLGPRDVLLTPGSPFPETLYLGHLNIFEVSGGAPSHDSPEVPVLHPGPALRARIAHWREEGARVLYAVGDTTTNFGGDPSGAEKEKQIFWRPELAAEQRAAALAALRSRLANAGLRFTDPVVSPGGQRYAEVRIADPTQPFAAPPAAPARIDPDELVDLFLADDYDLTAPYRAQRARYIGALAAALPDDPWIACDVAQLVCQTHPSRAGRPLACDPPRGCDLGEARGTGASAGGCFWGPVEDRAALGDYLARRARELGVGELSDWGFQANGGDAQLRLVVPSGAIEIAWQLTPACEVGAIDARATGDAPSPTTEQARHLVAELPVKTVQAAAGPTN